MNIRLEKPRQETEQKSSDILEGWCYGVLLWSYCLSYWPNADSPQDVTPRKEGNECLIDVIEGEEGTDRDDSHQVTSDSNNKRQVVALVTQRHSPEAMAQVIEKVQVLGIPVDSKTQALLKKTWMKLEQGQATTGLRDHCKV
ncbi:hypothetical protein Pmani_011529 [Petrolisthes manimaculis]|uniref:Uncharacterized protein n=1 Tax=Petrolisthes manimaculis TaxID=1843537 RepID=A0AAE1Q2R5_9EUCA|nr:hypothetical protein Pmani_011529 [Petrolisthes manimaculis]